MKNKKGLVGAIILIVFTIFFLIGLFLYYQIKTNGLTVSTGKITINIAYNNSEKKANLDNYTRAEANNSEAELNETGINISSDYLVIFEENQLEYTNMTGISY